MILFSFVIISNCTLFKSAELLLLLLLMIAFRERYSPLASRLTALLSQVI